MLVVWREEGTSLWASPLLTMTTQTTSLLCATFRPLPRKNLNLPLGVVDHLLRVENLRRDQERQGRLEPRRVVRAEECFL